MIKKNKIFGTDATELAANPGKGPTSPDSKINSRRE
tara:strand:+ start:114213 stop:114320 length:108 start_codon:yes stop_codon:yes gene_type:complete